MDHGLKKREKKKGKGFSEIRRVSVFHIRLPFEST